MWNFLKADLQELVAVVKEDAASLGIPVVEGNDDTVDGNVNRTTIIPDYDRGGIDNDNATVGTQNKSSPAQIEAERRMNLIETFTVPLLPKICIPKNSKKDDTTITDEIRKEEEEPLLQENLDSEPTTHESSDATANIVEADGDDAVDKEDVEDNDDVKGNDDYDDDDFEMDEYEIQQVQEYLKTFNINDEQIQQDIVCLLEKYNNTLQMQYNNLVLANNVITHEEFWERYYYRCDPIRIEIEWDRYDEQQQQHRVQDGPRPGTKIVTSVTSFFGDAARAVATGMSNALTEDLQSYDNDDDYDDNNVNDGNTNKNEITSTARGLATSLFGHATTSTTSQQRPPFVMNTAMDEDDDDEEEIGWDDDDDDEEDDDVEEEEEEQIVFDDNVGGSVMSSIKQNNRSTIENDSEVMLLCEQLKEQLKQAIEERDILHQTVSLQTKEITPLKSVAKEVSTDECNNKNNSSSDSATEIPRNDQTVIGDSNEDNVKELQNQVQELNDMICHRDNQILELQKQIQELNDVICLRDNQIRDVRSQHKTDSKTAHDLKLRCNELEQRLEELAGSVSLEVNDAAETVLRLEAENATLNEQLQATQSDFAASQEKIIQLQLELETMQEQLKNANEGLNIMSQQQSVVTTDESILVAVADTRTNMSSSDELTTSTGVKIAVPSGSSSATTEPQPPPSTVVSKILSNNNNNDDDDEEGWGDDWD